VTRIFSTLSLMTLYSGVFIEGVIDTLDAIDNLLI